MLRPGDLVLCTPVAAEIGRGLHRLEACAGTPVVGMDIVLGSVALSVGAAAATVRPFEKPRGLHVEHWGRDSTRPASPITAGRHAEADHPR